MSVKKILGFIILSTVCLFFYLSIPKMTHPKIYDCFTFFNELELLEVRLNELYDHVDKFVIVEANQTFRGMPKPFYFEEYRDHFARFLDKIIYIKIEDLPQSDSPWDREFHQRNQIIQGLWDLKDRDIVLISDADEIPAPSILKTIKRKLAFQPHKVFSLKQTMYTRFLNRKESIDWYGTTAATFKTVKELSPQEVRLRRNKVPLKRRLLNGGWHFQSLGGPDRFIYKITSFCHQEADIPANKDPILIDKIAKLYKLVPIDRSFPQYIQDHELELRALGFIDTAFSLKKNPVEKGEALTEGL